MSEQLDNTFTAYKGPEFQQKLMWQLLVEPEYAEKTISILAVEYFDDPNFKRLFLIILEYFKQYGKVPNLQNQSITQAINEFKTPNNQIEEESLFAVVDKIKLWNERILNQTLMHDGEVIQKATNEFIKQQEIRKLAEGVLLKVKTGEIRDKHFLPEFEEKVQKISTIGADDDVGSDATEGLEFALTKEFRKTIPTGVATIDGLTGGGLGKGEIGLILTPSGVGKTTLLTKIANTAREQNLNVLQIIFEDTKPQIQRKHVTLWTGIPLSQLDEQHELALQKSQHHINNVLGPGKLTIKKFSQEDTTMRDIKDYILREQKRWGFKYDILVLDYLDCLESHKKVTDRNEAELVIVKSFEALASDLDIPCWSAIQSNRSGFDAELVEAHQSGGNIKRLQKAHFFMSVAKTPDQKEASLANIRIIKARFAQDGQTFRDCIFNNDTMQIIINDERYVGGAAYANKKKITDDIIHENAQKIEEHAKGVYGLIHVAASNAIPDSPTIEDPLMKDMRDKFMQQNNIEEKKPLDLTQFKSPGISTREIDNNVSGDIGQLPDTLVPVVDLGGHHTTLREDEPEYTVKNNNEDILEIEDVPIENASPEEQFHPETAFHESQIQNDGVNEGVSEGVNEPLLELTNESEIKAGDVIKRPETGPIYLPPGVYTKNEDGDTVVLGVAKESKITPGVNKNVKFDLSEAEKILNIDPDGPTAGGKHLFDYLKKQQLKIEDIVKKE